MLVVEALETFEFAVISGKKVRMGNRLGDVPGVVTTVGNEKVQECGPVRSSLLVTLFHSRNSHAPRRCQDRTNGSSFSNSPPSATAASPKASHEDARGPSDVSAVATLHV